MFTFLLLFCCHLKLGICEGKSSEINENPKPWTGIPASEPRRFYRTSRLFIKRVLT